MGGILWLVLGLGCAKQGSTPLGDFEVFWDEETGRISVSYAGRPILEDARIEVGSGSADITFQAGSYLFENLSLIHI